MACRNSRSAGSTEAAAAICFRADSSRQPILPNSLLRHFVDVIAEKDGKRFLVSLKWQQLSGTAEQKVPFEVISLADAVTKDGFTKAYLVVGDVTRLLYGGGLASHRVAADKVSILTREHFVASANQGKL